MLQRLPGLQSGIVSVTLSPLNVVMRTTTDGCCRASFVKASAASPASVAVPRPRSHELVATALERRHDDYDRNRHDNQDEASDCHHQRRAVRTPIQPSSGGCAPFFAPGAGGSNVELGT